MPAMIVDTLLALLRLPRMRPEGSILRPVELVVTAQQRTDGVGISVLGGLPIGGAHRVQRPVGHEVPRGD